MARKPPRIYPRTLSGGEVRYDVTADHVDPDTGRRKQQRKTFRTVKEAKAWLAQQQADAARGLSVARSTRTVAQLMREWLEMHAPNVKPTTLGQYRGIIERHIIPQIGAIEVQALTARRLQLHYSALLKAGVGARTVRFVHERLKQALGHAKRLWIIANNPAEDARPPAMPRREMKTWGDEEIARFLAVADQSAYGPIWAIAVYTGMRRGELMGLRWQDIDWEGRVLRVRQSVAVIKGGKVTQTPKTGRQRTVAVWQEVLELLRAHRIRQNELRLGAGPLWQDRDLVFSSRTGAPVDPKDLRRDMLRLCALAEIEPIRIHDLRHTHATYLLRHGEQIKVVSERLGHTQTSMTMNVYAHALPDQHRETAERLGRLLARKA